MNFDHNFARIQIDSENNASKFFGLQTLSAIDVTLIKFLKCLLKTLKSQTEDS